MNPRENLLHSGTGSGTFQASPLSAFHFFRSYNYLLPNDVTAHLLSESAIQSTEPEKISSILHSESDRPFISKPYNYWQPGNTASSEFARTSTNLVSPVGSIFGNNYKRQRGEKKPIPDEQKDDKYFERRRRNNQAAKKSRDARKLREDQVALKAAILEHENAILRAQILTLRDEATTLRRLLMDKKISEL
ncbi:hypothetical protein RN001_006127 [Aquatica leii]|uniref:BZIP domain-containing protein n=1 Tax=Aquatica leii TaxID=1421715 RepID=A0AAN7SQ37_9COLE|nr:hypothetical protein RN001_006127 [Aquatica leii]